jgi:hypothetical protein
MNPTAITAVIGIATLGLGIVGLFQPGVILGFIGLAFLSPSTQSLALGEIRAVYGGMPMVLGAATLQAAFNPGNHRGRIALFGFLWLGFAGGRLLGVSIDGNPGLIGWVFTAVELGFGGALLVASRGG